MNYKIIRDLLFLLPAEMAHQLALQALEWSASWAPDTLRNAAVDAVEVNPVGAGHGGTNHGGTNAAGAIHGGTNPVEIDAVKVMGISFPNRIGTAAGLDKDARCIAGLAALGFGFLEVGTVTPKPQPGNLKPRLFRLEKEQALINRMGFNNAGLNAMLSSIKRTRIKSTHTKPVLGINIGKNLDTPIEAALDDYCTCLQEVYPLASYIAVNISSPNTTGLRSLQLGEKLPGFLAGLKEEHQTQMARHNRKAPLVVKIDPDLTDEEIGQLCQQLIEFEIDGVIVSNTTVDRELLASGSSNRYALECGGLSGAPLGSKANHALKITAQEVKGKMAIIGVGGVMSGAAAAEKIRLGADLVQLYTGLIYQGPQLIQDAITAIRRINSLG